MQDLDDFENDLIEQFKGHPVLAGITLLPDADFAAVLLQRRFLSLAFTPAYDLAIDLLEDVVGLRLARVILREEYPDAKGNTQSHREDMKDDLFQLGVSRTDLVETRPTAMTSDTITKTLDLIADAGRHGDSDLRLLTILRFWGEVLVSVEYGQLWRRMEPLLSQGGENRSRFYYPHHIHDAKAHSLAAASLLSATHSDRLGMRLSELLSRTDSAESFLATERAILRLKLDFYDQFAPMLAAATT